MATITKRTTSNMTTKIANIYGKHNATAQSMLIAGMLEVGATKTASMRMYEYSPEDCTKMDGGQAECSRYDIGAEYTTGLKSAPLDSKNPTYEEVCRQIETRLKMPNLHIEIGDNRLLFEKIEADPRSPKDIVDRAYRMGAHLNKRLGRLNKTLFSDRPQDTTVLAGALTPIVARGQVLTKIVKEKIEGKNDLLSMLYHWIARREREVLLYAHSKDVDKKRPYDEMTLHAIGEMIWVFNNCNPFENMKSTGTSSFKVKNEPFEF